MALTPGEMLFLSPNENLLHVSLWSKLARGNQVRQFSMWPLGLYSLHLESWFSCSRAVLSWTSYFTFLCLSLLICKVEMIIEPIS